MKKTFLILFILVFSFSPGIIYSQWSTSPDSHNVIGYGSTIKVIGDGTGGCYVIFKYNSPTKTGILKVDKYGALEWPERVELKGTRAMQTYDLAIPDGAGNLIISYSDMSYGTHALLKLQKIDKFGNFLWKDTGFWIDSTHSGMQSIKSLVQDGEYGCVLTWKDSISDVRINRIAPNGKKLWGEGGKLVIVKTHLVKPKLIKTSQDKFVFVEEDLWKWFDNQGNLLLTDTSHYPGNLISAEDGGIVFETYDGDWPENWNMYLRKVDSLGAPAWENQRIHIADSLFYNTPVLLYENEANFISLWVGKNNGVGNIPHFQITNANGEKLLTPEGYSLCNDSLYYPFIFAIPSSGGNTILAYEYNDHIRAQMFDTLGNIIWGDSDVIVSNNPSAEIFIPDEKGGFLYAGQLYEFALYVDQVSVNGNLGEVIVTRFEENASGIQKGFELFQNYPNPFNPSTLIKYQLPEKTHVKVEVFNILGQSVKILVDEEKPAGYYETEFTPVNLASGVYICNIRAGKFDQSVKMIYMK